MGRVTTAAAKKPYTNPVICARVFGLRRRANAHWFAVGRMLPVRAHTRRSSFPPSLTPLTAGYVAS
jgi:hypothetical protein